METYELLEQTAIHSQHIIQDDALNMVINSEHYMSEYELDKKHSIQMVFTPTEINNRHMFRLSADQFIFPNLNGSSVRQQTSVKRKLFY